MKPEPQVGDIWQWGDSPDYVLLIEQEQANEFIGLTIGTREQYPWVFSKNLMRYWTFIA